MRVAVVTRRSTRTLLITAALSATFLTAATETSAALTHRYSFTEATTGGTKGTVTKDSVGNTDAIVKGPAATVADGKLTLKNEDKTSDDAQLSYVEFAAPLIPRTGSTSIAVWFNANDAGAYARLVNFGDKEGDSGSAFIYLTARNGDDQSRGAITATDAASKTAQDNERLDDGKPHMIALVIDGAAKKLHIFIDGKEPKPAEDLGENTLDKVRPTNNWLGRSSFDHDPGLSGSIDEVRVYDHALSADEAAAAFKAGPDALPPAAPAAPSTKP